MAVFCAGRQLLACWNDASNFTCHFSVKGEVLVLDVLVLNRVRIGSSTRVVSRMECYA
jgi:hypothetical protein